MRRKRISEIGALAAELAFPIIPCNLCGSQEGLKREAMGDLLAKLEQDHPHLRSVMLNALRNVRPSHLLDRDVERAWRERAADVRPVQAPPVVAKHHHAAAPLYSGGKLRAL